jgi:hypothetical protein
MFEEQLLKAYKSISKEDLKLYEVVDSVDEAYGAILRLVRC